MQEFSRELVRFNVENSKPLKTSNNIDTISNIDSYQELDDKSISIDIIIGELSNVYFYNPREIEHFSSFNFNKDYTVYIKNRLQKGEPFELLDGDNLCFNHIFLKNTFDDLKRDKICVLSIIGPQSSGKSMLLNYILGCKFSRSVGRCTKGIYAYPLKIDQPNCKYLFILNYEGLYNPNKTNLEFNRKITLFCLAISKILIINVKCEMNRYMTDLLEICVYSLAKLNIDKIKKPCVFMSFNQNPGCATKETFAIQKKL